jgi:hypothetical protein
MENNQNQSENLDEMQKTSETTTYPSKKKIMNLSTFIFLILLIVITIMGIYIYKQNLANQKAACVIDPLKNNNILNSENIVESETESTITENDESPIENTIPAKESIPEYTDSEIPQILTEKQSEEKALSTLQEYINKKIYVFENSNIGPMPELLYVLELESYENINELRTNSYDPSTYIRSNTKYADFKYALLEYVTEDYFNKNFSQYTNINDNVGICNCAGGYVPFNIKKINFKSRDKDTYKFDVVLIDMELYPDSETDYLITKDVTFKLDDGKLLIDEF